MANRCQNILTISGDNLASFIEMMKAAEAGTIGYEKPFLLSEGDHEISFEYDTAWQPNLEWVKEQSMLANGSTFTLSYLEDMCFQCGQVVFKNGTIERQLEWTEKNDESISFIKETFCWDNYSA
jgi:hypothetical protein